MMEEEHPSLKRPLRLTQHDLVFTRGCTIGEDVKLFGPCNIYDTVLEDGVRVFNFCEIGGAKIGKNTKISSHSYICPGVSVGQECFIGHGTMTTNDVYSDVPEYASLEELGTKWKSRRTIIGDRVRIGSNATILPVVIGDGAIIGAGSVVTHDVPAGETWAGVPAKKIS